MTQKQKVRTTTVTRLLGAGVLLSSFCGCAEEQGDVRFETWGEEYIERGIPEDEFEDGWEARYDKFLVVLGAVRVADGDELGGELGQAALFDLTASGPHPVGELTGLEAGQWPDVSYEITQADDDTERHSSASAEDLELMEGAGYSIYVSGTASSGDRELSFSWGFDVATRYRHCVDVRGGQETNGIVISDGTSATHELTIHGDHFFYDDLAGDAVLRFDALALADADADGDVTLEELDDVSLSELPSDLGSYGVGAFDVDTLGQFVRAASTTLGHFDGEGHCNAEPF